MSPFSIFVYKNVLLEFFDKILNVPNLDGDEGKFALKERGHCFDISKHLILFLPPCHLLYW